MFGTIPHIKVDFCSCCSSKTSHPRRAKGDPPLRLKRHPPVPETSIHLPAAWEKTHLSIFFDPPQTVAEPADLHWVSDDVLKYFETPTIDPYLDPDASILRVLSTSPATPVEPFDIFDIDETFIHSGSSSWPQTPYQQPQEIDLQDPKPFRLGWEAKSITKDQLAKLLLTDGGLYKCIVNFGLRGDHIEDPDIALKVKILERCYLDSQYLVEEIGQELLPYYSTPTRYINPPPPNTFWTPAVLDSTQFQVHNTTGSVNSAGTTVSLQS